MLDMYTLVHSLNKISGYGQPLSTNEFKLGRHFIGKVLPFEEDPAPSFSKNQKNLLSGVAKTWPQGPIPYKIDTAFSAAERSAIAGGMADIEDNTCITFVDAGSPPSGDYIWITTGDDGCYVLGAGYTKDRGAHLMNLVQLPFCSLVGVQGIIED